MSITQVEFFSDGVRLVGDLYTPDGADDRLTPGVAVANGFTGIRSMWVPDVAEALCEAGMTALIFDHRGLGDSEGSRGWLIPEEQVADVRSALTYLDALDSVDSSRLALYGTSFGAGNAVAAAARDPRVTCVVGVVGVYDGRDWMRSLRTQWEWLDFLDEVERDWQQEVRTNEGRRLDPAELVPRAPDALKNYQESIKQFPERRIELPLKTGRKLLEFSPLEEALNIPPRPVLIIGVERDTISPVHQSYALAEQLGSTAELVILDAERHHAVYDPPWRDTILDHARAFYREHLQLGG